MNIINNQIKNIASILKNNGYQTRLVGGCVRDYLLGIEPNDIDLATDATPDQVMDIFEKSNFETIPTGLQHGTVTLNDPESKENYEITTLRTDINPDGRHSEVEFVTDFETDAKRRDFTINAMSMDIDGNIYDYFGGKDDLKNNIVRFVGDAESRIKEDYLRILRYYRFMGKLNTENMVIDQDTITAIQNNVSGLQEISGTRVMTELKKVMEYSTQRFVLDRMEDHGVLSEIRLQKNEQIYKLEMETVSKLYLMSTDKEYLMDQFPFTRFERSLLIFFKNQETKSPTLSDAIDDIIVKGEKFLPRYTELFAMRNKVDDYQFLKNFVVPQFQVQGRDLEELGIKSGPYMGKLINQLKRKWIESNFQASKEELLTSLK